MAEAAPPGQSESMEDILQSIKRIIEDDTGAEAKAEAKPAAAAKEADVLDLTEVVKDDAAAGPAPKLSPIPTPAPSGDVVKTIDAMFANDKAAEAPAPKPAEQSVEKPVDKAPEKPVDNQAAIPVVTPAPKPRIMEDGLVSNEAAQAAAAALKPIVEGAQKDYSVPHIPSPGLRTGSTVEDLLLEALRPMLKSWLDEHLPTIVQKIVEKEVKRIVTFHQD